MDTVRKGQGLGRRPGRPSNKIEEWNTKDKLHLAIAVHRCHKDKTWDNVSAIVKRCGDRFMQSRYTPHQCAVQFEAMSKKHLPLGPKESILNQANKLIKILSAIHATELRVQVDADIQKYIDFKKEIKDIEAGKFSREHLIQMYNELPKDAEDEDDSELYSPKLLNKPDPLLFLVQKTFTVDKLLKMNGMQKSDLKSLRKISEPEKQATSSFKIEKDRDDVSQELVNLVQTAIDGAKDIEKQSASGSATGSAPTLSMLLEMPLRDKGEPLPELSKLPGSAQTIPTEEETISSDEVSEVKIKEETEQLEKDKSEESIEENTESAAIVDVKKETTEPVPMEQDDESEEEFHDALEMKESGTQQINDDMPKPTNTPESVSVSLGPTVDNRNEVSVIAKDTAASAPNTPKGDASSTAEEPMSQDLDAEKELETEEVPSTPTERTEVGSDKPLAVAVESVPKPQKETNDSVLNLDSSKKTSVEDEDAQNTTQVTQKKRRSSTKLNEESKMKTMKKVDSEGMTFTSDEKEAKGTRTRGKTYEFEVSRNTRSKSSLDITAESAPEVKMPDLKKEVINPMADEASESKKEISSHQYMEVESGDEKKCDKDSTKSSVVELAKIPNIFKATRTKKTVTKPQELVRENDEDKNPEVKEIKDTADTAKEIEESIVAVDVKDEVKISELNKKHKEEEKMKTEELEKTSDKGIKATLKAEPSSSSTSAAINSNIETEDSSASAASEEKRVTRRTATRESPRKGGLAKEDINTESKESREPSPVNKLTSEKSSDRKRHGWTDSKQKPQLTKSKPFVEEPIDQGEESESTESSDKRVTRAKARTATPLSSSKSPSGRGSVTPVDPSMDDSEAGRSLRSRSSLSTSQLPPVLDQIVLTSQDSYPNSPCSSTATSLGDEEKEHKTFKKSIMLVWNRIAAHKFASVFMKPISEEKAPGYFKTVLRPMDLTTLKKNIESGMIRNVIQFERDTTLIFMNAMMFNPKTHEVYPMAIEMYRDASNIIEEFKHTQKLLKISTEESSESSVFGRREESDQEMGMDEAPKATSRKRSRISMCDDAGREKRTTRTTTGGTGSMTGTGRK